ncbi:MAG: hypothetical protein O7C75_07130 [Verrucomicrobia bacterium]|nr:hypothetical protein [Verrucomicrobiota bacterium]
MQIKELGSCFQITGGLFYFACMCDKIRVYAEGNLPEDYFFCLMDWL